MPHIDLQNDLPGMRSLLAYRPEIAGPLGDLTNVLLRTSDDLSRADRELIATYVSNLNECLYCTRSHAEIAVCYLGGDRSKVDQVRKDYNTALIPEKLKTLLHIAGKVQQGGGYVRPEDIDNARNAGASDRNIHDTVLIAAAFCLYNRYVDGLATVTPEDLSTYPPRARQVAEHGYGGHIYQEKQPV